VSERTFLDEITIRSIGVIDQATIEFSSGLTVLTGETGAGKTMILTALNLILGGKSDSALVRKGSERLITSGRFRVPADLNEVFDNYGVEIENNELIISRSVTGDGKSKATCNGIAVTANTLVNMSEFLVEVHGQAANLNISKSSKQRELVDKFAGDPFMKSFVEYSKIIQSYFDLKSRMDSLKKSIAQKDSELQELRDFVSKMEKLKLSQGEYSKIDAAIERLSNVEQLRIAGITTLVAIDDEDSGALKSLSIARHALDSARTKDVDLEAIHSKVSEGYFLIDDARTELATYIHSLEADPDQLDLLNSRKAAIHALIKKYGGDGSLDVESDNLVQRFSQSAETITDLEGGDERLHAMEIELKSIKETLVNTAKQLTKVRTEAASKLSILVTREIQELAMPHTTFSVQVKSVDYSSLKESDFTSVGCDEISMFISSHKDAPLVALAKGASGGEMSRVMLALEVVLAGSHPVGTYIFDEVDAGVGGKAAIEVGRRLFALSRYAQVVVVTHLPQVAAWADSHFVVTKDINGSVSQSDVRKVEGEDRIEEIARMLAGLENSTSAREHAAELLSLKV